MKLNRAIFTVSFLVLMCLVREVAGDFVAPPIIGRPVKLTADANAAITSVLKRYQVFAVDLIAVDRAARSHNRLSLRFGEFVFDIKVEAANIRRASHRAFHTEADGRLVQDPTLQALYRGWVVGESDSRVLFIILPGLFEGSLYAKDRHLRIEPLRRIVRGFERNVLLVYDRDDIKSAAAGICATDTTERPVARLPDANLRWAQDLAQSGKLVATVATDADYELWDIYGEDTNAHIEGVIGDVNEVFKRELKFELAIGDQFVFTDPNAQPYTERNADELLDKFQNYWNENHQQVSRVVAHLFTGKELEDSVKGVAKMTSAWNLISAYGLSSDVGVQTQLTAHEIAHNFGAHHDCDECSCTQCVARTGPVMCPCLQRSAASLNFSDVSQCQVSTYLNGHQP